MCASRVSPFRHVLFSDLRPTSLPFQPSSEVLGHSTEAHDTYPDVEGVLQDIYSTGDHNWSTKMQYAICHESFGGAELRIVWEE